MKMRPSSFYDTYISKTIIIFVNNELILFLSNYKTISYDVIGVK